MVTLALVMLASTCPHPEHPAHPQLLALPQLLAQPAQPSPEHDHHYLHYIYTISTKYLLNISSLSIPECLGEADLLPRPARHLHPHHLARPALADVQVADPA